MNFIDSQIYTFFLHKTTRTLPKPIIKNIFGIIMDGEKLRGLEICLKNLTKPRCTNMLKSSCTYDKRIRIWWINLNPNEIYNRISPYNMCDEEMWNKMIFHHSKIIVETYNYMEKDIISGIMYWRDLICRRLYECNYFKVGLYI